MFNPNFDFSDCEDPAPKKPGRGEPGRSGSSDGFFFYPGLAVAIALSMVAVLWSGGAFGAITPTKCLSAHKQLAGGHQTILYQMPLNCSVSILGFSQPTLP